MGLPPGDFSLLERFMQCGQVATEVEMWNINKAESFILRNYMLSLQATQVQDFCVYHPRGKFDEISHIFTCIWLYTSRRELTNLYYSRTLAFVPHSC